MKIYCDGSGWNGRESRWCVTGHRGHGGHHIERYDYERTNNEMEYAAVSWALNIAEDGDTVYTDSQLVVNQVNGKWKVKEQRLADFCRHAKEKLQSKRVTLVWIPREENLAGKVLDK